ncbi:hypothetical protein ACRRTK_009465 [Alexandromys fortis]
MVWIHGGGLVLGGASSYDGLACLPMKNVVVVVLQYRLSIWGFFSTGDKHSLGNWGHLDQVAALHWVQDNIVIFGGDPGSGTVFGESAGGHPSSPPVVNTVHGKVLGKYVSLKGFAQPVAIFLGVPFAKPPLGSLRFAPPQPAEPWSFVKNTTSYPPMCSQDAVGGQALSELFTNRKENIPLQFSEDCLYLNIYTPADLTKNSQLPVMVWIHGGTLVVGGASTYDGLALSAHENVVVVSIQYRLGIWGFFSTGDEHSKGNWGHLDQVAALRWVQDNIANFGGNPGSVTIFGGSAGGFCVSALVLSPLAKNLFHRAISQSGVALTAALFTENVKPIAELVANLSGCETTTSAVMVHCLRQKTEEELMETSQRMTYPFLPTVVDGVFLPKTPEEILAEKSFNTVPYMVGTNKQEFGWILPMKIPENLIQVATDKYLERTDDPAKKKNTFLDIFADVIFNIPSVMVSRGHRDGASEEETNLSKTVMKFWANFARNGNPNGRGLPHWPEYDQKEGYMKLGTSIQAAHRLKDVEVVFWTELRAKEAAERAMHREHAEL